MCELKDANHNPTLSGVAIYSNFMAEDVVVKGAGKRPKMQYFRQMIGYYRQSIRGILPCDLRYIGYVLNEVGKVI